MLLTLLPRLTNAEEAMEEDEEVSADTALVELLLSLLQRPQTVVRPVVEEVFKAFATDLSEESIDSLIEVRSF